MAINIAERAIQLDVARELDGTEMIEISQGSKGRRIIASQVHALEITPVNGVASAGKLTSSGALVPGTHAVSVLTSDATNVSEGDTVTIGSTVYRFKYQVIQVSFGVYEALQLMFLLIDVGKLLEESYPHSV